MDAAPETPVVEAEPAARSQCAADLHSALEWLDQRLDAALDALARTHGPPAPADAYRGLAIADDEATQLLAREPGFSLLYTPAADWPALPPDSRLAHLSTVFALTPPEQAVLLLALAPEIDLRYERLYGYLQDDVTRRWPGVELALNLFCPDLAAKLALRAAFDLDAPLFRYQLLQRYTDPGLPHPPLLGTFLRIDEGIARYLLGGAGIDPRLLPFAGVSTNMVDGDALIPSADPALNLALPDGAYGPNGAGPLVYFQGPYGVGKRTSAAAAARAHGRGLLIIAGAQLAAAAPDVPQLVRLAVREARLHNLAIYWRDFDRLLGDELVSERTMLLRALAAQPGPSFLGGASVWEPEDDLADLPFVRIALPLPDYAARTALWRRALGDGEPYPAHAAEELAAMFRLTGGQIRDAAATARRLAQRRDPARAELTPPDLTRACRLHSNRRLAELAQAITPHYTWNDIVLPDDRMTQLREICNSVRYRSVVYGAWGFERRLALGKGLNVLFTGPSGTGKTMAAEVIAGELGLELYKIDLATVVSKYIGETEKNLARIFAEAESSNAILFFDEADALFGKRSEVKDAHDRYANVEIAYLLQRMEEYAGITILATNLRKNMDEAFVRRLHFIVEFPFPDARYRRRIWERVWPAEAPRDPGLAFEELAQRHEIAGGAIRNIALAAAFLAAADGQVVTMAHLNHATRREYQKLGRLVSEATFS